MLISNEVLDRVLFSLDVDGDLTFYDAISRKSGIKKPDYVLMYAKSKGLVYIDDSEDGIIAAGLTDSGVKHVQSGGFAEQHRQEVRKLRAERVWNLSYSIPGAIIGALAGALITFLLMK